MDSERWKRIDGLLQALWTCPASERAAFLRRACTGDESIARDVQALMPSAGRAGAPLDDAALWTMVAEHRRRAQSSSETAESTMPMQLAGHTVRQYRIQEMLGAGGMGVVYKAYDTKLDRPVALKFLPAPLRGDAQLRQRLSDEARAASALDHPNIVIIYAIDETPAGDLFIAMAYHEGMPLRERIEQAKPAGLPVGEALQIARQIAAGLSKAHERGILHRDIKPGNVIVSADGVARIIDFGLAKSTDATATMDTARGTPLYMSPEQASGKPLDCRTDIWSLGAVLYEMLAGVPPFSGQGHLAVMHSIVHDSPRPLRDARPGVPPEAALIVGKALEKDPGQRYPSAAAMERDLAALLSGSFSPPRPRRALPWKRMAAAAAALCAVAAGSYWYLHRTPRVTSKTTLVLADFENTTGDPGFDRTLRQGLSVELAQLPSVSLVSDVRVRRWLKLMLKRSRNLR